MVRMVRHILAWVEALLPGGLSVYQEVFLGAVSV